MPPPLPHPGSVMLHADAEVTGSATVGAGGVTGAPLPKLSTELQFRLGNLSSSVHRGVGGGPETGGSAGDRTKGVRRPLSPGGGHDRS